MDEGRLRTKGTKADLPAKSVLAADSKVNSVSGSLCHDGYEQFTRKYAMRWGSFTAELDGMGDTRGRQRDGRGTMRCVHNFEVR